MFALPYETAAGQRPGSFVPQG